MRPFLYMVGIYFADYVGWYTKLLDVVALYTHAQPGSLVSNFNLLPIFNRFPLVGNYIEVSFFCDFAGPPTTLCCRFSGLLPPYHQSFRRR